MVRRRRSQKALPGARSDAGAGRRYCRVAASLSSRKKHTSVPFCSNCDYVNPEDSGNWFLLWAGDVTLRRNSTRRLSPARSLAVLKA
ncbi:unnamed protein product, partial [Iphiclides podalirius]